MRLAIAELPGSSATSSYVSRKAPSRIPNRRGVNVTVRNTRGRSIAAACGQLAQVTNGKRRSIPVRSA